MQVYVEVRTDAGKLVFSQTVIAVPETALIEFPSLKTTVSAEALALFLLEHSLKERQAEIASLYAEPAA